MQSFTDVWERALEIIQPQVSGVSFESWIKLLRPVKMENNVAFFYVRTLFQKGTIQNNFMKVIEQSLTDAIGFPVTAEIITEVEAPPRIIEKAKENEEHFNEVLAKNEEYIAGPQQKLTFENFVVGNENKFAHAAALAVANNPGNAYNPLFIYGRSGLGKTHLMVAIANEIKRNNNDAVILYIKSEEFVNEMVEALQRGKMKEFRSKYRYVDAFLVDDVQFIADKEAIQEEFFHTFETLHEAKKQIVLTSDRPPKEMLTLTERLRSRFLSGVIADVQPPEFETRCAIIKNKADSLGLILSNEIVEYVAKKLHTNVRELEGCINKIKAYNVLYNERPTLETAQQAISSVISENAPSAISVDLIIDTVARYFNISVDEIKGQRRQATIATPRQIAMYISRELTNMSLAEIGSSFGGKDHTTVLHSINKISGIMDGDPKLSQTVHDLMENIKKSF